MTTSVTNSAELNAAVSANEADIQCASGAYVLDAAPGYSCTITLAPGASISGAATGSNTGPVNSEAQLLFNIAS